MSEDQILLEVCAESVDSAMIAQSAGAYRIEFCNDLKEGGITPSFAQIEIARRLLHIKLYVLIRPRGGDFLYNENEFEVMKSEIDCCGRIGCDGVVIGMLLPDGRIDMKRCAELVRIAKDYSMGVTFHRAFDRSCDLSQSLEDVISLGCERILTSGGRDTALEGANILKELIQAGGDRITIMPGAGITPENVGSLLETTGLKELHGTFRSSYPSRMIYRNQYLTHPDEEYSIMQADFFKIREVLQTINN